MANEKDAALLSLYAYQANDRNVPLVQTPWEIIKEHTEGTQGFAYAVFRNTSTNEIVIAYRGSDDITDWLLTNSGLTIAQERQAAVVAAQYIDQYGANNVSFTGHSMGGGLAATIAVWFNRPATVFDPAPTQAVATDLAVVNSVIGLIGGASAPQSILDYSTALSTQFGVRENNVTSYYAPGSGVRAISTAANTITGQGNPLQFGVSKMEVGSQLINLHNQALLTAGVLAPQSFPQATMAVQWTLPILFDETLYNLRTDRAERNFLLDAIRSEQQLPGNGKITHFSADLNKLGTNLAGLNDAAQKALIAQGIEWYYWQGTDYAGQEFFTRTGELLQYTTATGVGLQGALNKASSYVDKWLTPVVNAHDEFYSSSFSTRYDQWNVGAGSTGVTATALIAAKSQIFIGGAGADNFTGGDLSDLILAGGGNDTLRGGAGADLLYGGAGLDTYYADEGDTIRDSDGKGVVYLNGKQLTFATRKKGETVWTDASGNTYAMNAGKLQINDPLTIEDFDNGELGIYLDEEEDPSNPNGRPHAPGYNPNNASLIRRWDPLVLDLDGNGQIDAVGSANSTIYFDFNGDGVSEKAGWIAPQDGFLTLAGGAQYGDARVHRSADGKHLYVQVNAETLLIDGNLIVNDYTPGDTSGALGLNMTSAVAEQNPQTTQSITGDLAPLDIVPAYQQPDGTVHAWTDALGNLLVIKSLSGNCRRLSAGNDASYGDSLQRRSA